jgi:hypothetical protein
MRPTLNVLRSLQACWATRPVGFVLLFGGFCALLLCLPAPAFGDMEYMTVNFDDKTVGQPIGTGGPSNGEPSWIDDGLAAIVRSTPYGTRCLEFSSVSASGDMGFDLDSPVSSGVVAIVADVWFYDNNDWMHALKLRNSYNQQIATIWFDAGGLARITALDFTTIENIPYVTGRSIPILMIVDFDARTWSVWIDEFQWVNNEPLFEQIENFKRVMVNVGYGTTEDSRCSIDQIRVLDYVPEVPVRTTTWGTLRALYR